MPALVGGGGRNEGLEGRGAGIEPGCGSGAGNGAGRLG